MRQCRLLGPYSWPRALRWSWGGGGVSCTPVGPAYTQALWGCIHGGRVGVNESLGECLRDNLAHETMPPARTTVVLCIYGPVVVLGGGGVFL